MGSRRRRHASLSATGAGAFAVVTLTLTLAVAAVVVATGCGSAPPPGFAGGTGDQWAFPLIGPMEDGLLITPVQIDGHGPFVFAIDPDANVSVVDEDVVRALGVATAKGPRRVDEAGAEQPRFYAQLRAVELGSLIVESVTAMVSRTGTHDAYGRRIHGVLGRDVLADALVFGFDRDRGLGYLTTVKAFTPPPGAIAIRYQRLPARVANAPVQPVDRRIATARLGSTSLAMHLDLGSPTSQLRGSRWSPLGLVPVDVQATAIDEVGTPRRVTQLTVGEGVAVGAAVADQVVFVPYEDHRFSDAQVDGALGLDFFRRYVTWMHWDAAISYLVPRQAVAVATRMARWDLGVFARCTQPGCVSIRVVDPLAGKPADPTRPHPGLVLSVAREELAGGMALEVVVEAQDRPDLPRLVINLPPNADRALQHLKPTWVGARLTVIDASPFPRACPAAGGCIDLLAR